MESSRLPPEDQGVSPLIDRWLQRKPRQVWLEAYSASHQHPFNQWCHLIGIPLIAASLPLGLLIPFWPAWWFVPASMFAFGWLLQFLGHFVERKPPEFLRDWRFLLIGFTWWLDKMRIRKRIEGPPQS
jgi:uncharacterized membrane protein YGL010W